MKQLAGTVGKILFWIFAVAVFFWTASLSLAALRSILPGDPIKPYVGLVLTDIGALTWLLVFIGQAQGLPQRAVSLIMFIVDLAGVILLSAFELLTSGQNLAEVPATMGTAVIWGVIGLTLVNLAAAYFYHLAEPQTWKQIEFGVLTDRLQGEAMQQATRNVEAEAQKLGAILAARATAELKYNLRLPMSDFETAEHTRRDLPAPKVIDAQATDPGKPPSVFEKIFKKDKPPSPIAQPAPVATYAAETDQVKACKKCGNNPAASGSPYCVSCLEDARTHFKAQEQPMTREEAQKLIDDTRDYVNRKFSKEDGSQPPAPFPG